MIAKYIVFNFMKIALKAAQKAALKHEVPVGAIIIKDLQIISKGYNKTLSLKDPSAHAEIIAIRKACKKLNSHILDECTIITTLEPCAMCAQAISNAHIKTLIFGAYDPKSGGVEHGALIFKHSHHKPNVIGGVLEDDCANIIKTFFQNKRHN